MACAPPITYFASPEPIHASERMRAIAERPPISPPAKKALRSGSVNRWPYSRAVVREENAEVEELEDREAMWEHSLPNSCRDRAF